MKRHPALVELSIDHHQGLLLAQVLMMQGKSYPGYPIDTEGKSDYTLSFFKTELIRHFRKEEEIVFPNFRHKNKKLDDLIDEILDEHLKFYEMIRKIEDDKENYKLLLDFGKLLESHIRKEERQLFQMIQELADEKIMTSIKEKIESFAQNQLD